jgi:hypothetical protein
MLTKATLASGVAVVLLLFVCVLVAYAHDHDRAAPGELMVFVIIATGTAIIFIVAYLLWRRDLNPHTGLPSRIRTRRLRGPLLGKKQ